MLKETLKPRIVTHTLQRCAECGWCHSPAVLAFNFITRSSGFYCLDCYCEASNRGDLDPRKEVTTCILKSI